jgi:TRAP transporter TAXI family solute receptor
MKVNLPWLINLAVLLSSLFCIPHTVAEEGIGMVTGSKTGTYFQFGKNIADTVKNAGLNIIVKESEGSIDNIRRLNSTENATLGIVQSDVLGFLNRSESPEMRKVSNRIRLVFPFYNEEVHLFANKKIQRFSDLEGKRVVVGEKGSGNWLTATNLLQMTGVKLGEALNIPPLKAVTAVLQGEADAMIYVAGKPVELFAKLGNLKEKPEFAPLFNDVHFVPLEETLMLREYKASEIGPSDYRWIDKKVPTIAVKAVLMSFDYSSKKTAYFRQRCQELAIIGQAIRNNLDNLKQNGHPKWQEVNLEDKVGTWELDTCSREPPAKAGPKVDISKELEKVLLNQFKQ